MKCVGQLSWVLLGVLALITNALSLPSGARGVREGDKVTYIAAVVEYEPFVQKTEEGGEGITMTNAATLSQYAAKAKAKGADIVVTPEAGVAGLLGGWPDISTLTQYVPDPQLGALPCHTDGDWLNFQALKNLSCAARDNGVYLVVDVAEVCPCSPEAAALNPFPNALDTAYECPSSGVIHYNTQVVFDRNGTVIARYRKKNLYLEPKFYPGLESDDTAIFTTDFGVKFSLQVCFDIAYAHPGLTNVMTRGVKDVAMSTAWVDILPFFLAPSVQNGWSRSLGVNLLVAGHHLPESSKLGSGIYRGFSDMNQDYVYDPDSGDKLIVSEVETVAATDGVLSSKLQRNTEATSKAVDVANNDVLNVQQDQQPRSREHLMYYDDISQYTNIFLSPDEAGEPQVVEICHNDEICCSLTYTSTSSLYYSLLAYSGLMLQGNGNYAMYVQVCAVVWCKTQQLNTCSFISEGLPPSDQFHVNVIQGDFSADNIFPVAITRNLTLVDNSVYSVTSNGNLTTFKMQQQTQDLLSAGMFARWYSRDPQHVADTSFYQFFTSIITRIVNFFG